MPTSHGQDVNAINKQRLRVVLTTIGINVVAVALFAVVPWSNWRTAVGLNVIDNALLLAFALRHRDALMGRLIVFGMITGIFELAADAWLVDYTRTLDYSMGGGLMIWRSPLWMPFAWQVVAVQFGYIGLRLYERFGVAGLLLNGVLGAINIPYYEEMARAIHWWSYSGCRMISHTPFYIIVGEFGIAVALALLARPMRDGDWGTSVQAGLAGGAAIFASYFVAFGLTDGWR